MRIVRYLAFLFMGFGQVVNPGGGGGGGGTVTNSGTLTNNAVALGAGTTVVKTDTGATTDGAGAFTAVSYATSTSSTVGIPVKAYSANAFATFIDTFNSLTNAQIQLFANGSTGYGGAAAGHVGLYDAQNSRLILDCSSTSCAHGVMTATTVNGTTIPTSGTLTQTIASGTSALGTGAISSATCATVVTTTATGTASTDAISWNPNASIKAVTGYTPSTSGGLTIAAYPTTNAVNFDVCNWTSSSITPGAVTLNWRVVR